MEKALGGEWSYKSFPRETNGRNNTTTNEGRYRSGFNDKGSETLPRPHNTEQQSWDSNPGLAGPKTYSRDPGIVLLLQPESPSVPTTVSL